MEMYVTPKYTFRRKNTFDEILSAAILSRDASFGNTLEQKHCLFSWPIKRTFLPFPKPLANKTAFQIAETAP